MDQTEADSFPWPEPRNPGDEMIRNNQMKLGPEPIPFQFVAPVAVALVALTLAMAPVTLGASGVTLSWR